jgi:carboxylate-amine ligase
MRTLLNSRTINSIRDVWWDVRPHLGFGTVEVRICDALPTLSENLAVVALVQCLVAHLSNLYDQGHPIPVLKHWTLVENKWRAIRHGFDAEIIRNERGEIVSVVDHLRETIDLLMPTAESLGCQHELASLEDIIEHGNSTMRQRRIWNETRDLSRVVDALISELRNDSLVLPGKDDSIEVWTPKTAESAS